MKTVYKFPFHIQDDIVLLMPAEAKILHVELQQGSPCIWAMVKTEAPLERRTFRLAGTGHPLDEKKKYTHVGTFQMHGGELVFHLFEVQ